MKAEPFFSGGLFVEKRRKKVEKWWCPRSNCVKINLSGVFIGSGQLLGK